MSGREDGFTLLEVLVAVVVLGFVLAGIAGGVQFGQRAADMQARSIAGHTDMGAADRLLRQLVASLDPGTASTPPSFTGGASALGFTAELPNQGEADIGLGVDAAGRLVLRWTPAVHAIRLVAAPSPQSSVLLDGLDRVEFAYWGRGEGGAGQWLGAWVERDIPALIRIRLHFMAAAHRTWPDIIAATERVRNAR